jgi:hypothetical protein
MTKLSKAETHYRQGDFAHHCGPMDVRDGGSCSMFKSDGGGFTVAGGWRPGRARWSRGQSAATWFATDGKKPPPKANSPVQFIEITGGSRGSGPLQTGQGSMRSLSSLKLACKRLMISALRLHI